MTASASVTQPPDSLFTPQPGTHAAAVEQLVRYLRREVCGVYSAEVGTSWPCAAGTTLDHSDVCPDGWALPLWTQRRQPGQTWPAQWTLVSADVTCLGAGRTDPAPEQVLTAFRRLPIAAPAFTVQPGDWRTVLVHKPTIVYADDPTVQTLATTLLGAVVTFTVSPLAYTWDFGERSLTTVSPGHAYPDQDVFYAYSHVGTRQITLTTTWSATYTLDDDPTVHDVPGTATTVSPAHTVQVEQVDTRLVRGTCQQYPDDWGCPADRS